MSALRVVGAAFDDRRAGLVGPFDFALESGDYHRLDAASQRAASIAARMFAAIVKPTRGNVYVAEYDTRLQPPQAKRRLGFVDAAGFAGTAHDFACELAFRADVWGLDRTEARGRVRDVLARLELGGEACARAVALALIADVALVVLDQPLGNVADALRAVAPSLAVVETRVARPVPRELREPLPA